MTFKSPIFTVLILLFISSGSHSQSPRTNTAKSLNNNQLASTDGLTDPHQILRNAVAELQKRKTIEVKIRMQTEIHGHKLFGSGMYQQQGGGPAAKLRLEMKIGPAEKRSTLLNVCDGQYLWMRKQLPMLKELQRVNMKTLVDAMIKKNPNLATSPEVMMFGPSIGVGGFSYVLQSIEQHFEFDKIEVRRLKTIEVYVLSGKLKKQSIARILPKQAAAILAGKPFDASKLPIHVPERIVVYLGRNDLFPYQIQYIRKMFEKVGGKQSEEKVDKVYMNLQMHQRKFDMPIPATQFIYKPGNQKIWDLTNNYLMKFGLK